MSEPIEPQPGSGDLHLGQERQVSARNMSSHLQFLRTLDGCFMGMTDEKAADLQAAFELNLAQLPTEQQTAISNSLAGITADITLRSNMHPGIAASRVAGISRRILCTLEDVGIVDSVTPGGVQFIHDAMSNHTQGMNEGIRAFEQSTRGKMSNRRTPEAHKAGRELLTYTEAIAQELRRLGLTSKTGTQSIEPLAYNEYESLHLLSVLQATIKLGLVKDGLIGFCTLNDLISTFFQVNKNLERSSVW